ncbi:hypothetical protein OPV22_011433 [Ensete ventricosum]|uniref:Anthocyanidin 3-O-glucosyltransferase n=1 Tax=Ensete ventricosum TaxID=4639 RepID=A0AAV8RDF9_ENSVE|nr:hypothetical protein OPV22_011433 [Ensete ventricosum]
MGSPASKQHVAFVAFPFGSHPGAIFPVARAVAAAAPSAVVSFLGTVRALASLPPADDTPNLRFVAVADGVPDGSPPPREVLELIGLFLEATPGNLKEGMAAAVAGASGAPVSCVVSDAFVWMSGEVAEEMRVPWVPLCPGGTAALSAHLHTDLLRRKLGVGDQAIAGREDELLDFIPGLSVHRVRDLPEGVVAGPLDSPFSVLLHRMAERLPKAAAIAFNTIPGLEPAIEESFATDGVLKALDTLLRGEEGKRLRARAAELKVIANRAVAPGGTSTKNFASLLDFLLPEIKLNS